MEKLDIEKIKASAPTIIGEETVRVGIYLRVSSAKGKDQDIARQEYGINKHLETNPHKQLWCEKKGVYIDHASGGGWSRKALNRVLADMKRNFLDEIIFYEIDRLGRDTRESLNYINKVNDLGCSVYVCDSDTYAKKGNDGWMRLQMMIVWAEMELAKITSRTKSGNERKKAALAEAAKRLGYDYLRCGRPGIIEQWVKDPLGAKLGKKGFVVAPDKVAAKRFTRLWDSGVEIVEMQSLFPNAVAPSCEHWRVNAKGKAVKRKGDHGKQVCKCNVAVSSKTIHTTRVKLNLAKRHEGAWGHARHDDAAFFGIKIKSAAAPS